MYEGLLLTVVLHRGHTAVHACACAAVADCAGEGIFVALVIRRVSFLDRAAVGVRRTSGSPPTRCFGFLVGSVKREALGNAQAICAFSHVSATRLLGTGLGYGTYHSTCSCKSLQVDGRQQGHFRRGMADGMSQPGMSLQRNIMMLSGLFPPGGVLASNPDSLSVPVKAAATAAAPRRTEK